MDLSDQRANLIEEGLDLSIRITAELQPGDIVRKLGQCHLLTLASPDYLALHGELRHPSDLRHHECLIYASDNAVTTWPYREGEHTQLMMSSAWLSFLAKISVLGVSLRAGKISVSTAVFMASIT